MRNETENDENAALCCSGRADDDRYECNRICGKRRCGPGAVENTWNAAKSQVQTVVNNVVFPVIDMILAVLFFVKVGTSYFEYRKHGQFEFAAPCILFACLIFTLTAPLYIWTII